MQFLMGGVGARVLPEPAQLYLDRFAEAVERDQKLLAIECADIASEVNALRARLMGLSALVRTRGAQAVFEDLAEKLGEMHTDADGGPKQARVWAEPGGFHAGEWAE